MESALPGALFYFGRHYWRLAVFPKARGFRCLRHPGSIGHVLRTDRWVRPGNGCAFWAGSEGSYKVWRQTAGILYSRKQKGSGAFRRPGSSRRRACRPWTSPVPPTERAGSEGVINAACRPHPLWWLAPPPFPLKGNAIKLRILQIFFRPQALTSLRFYYATKS